MGKLIGWSDGRRELVECCADAVAGGDVSSEFVVPAAKVLGERVPGGDDPRGTVALQASHRPRQRFQPAGKRAEITAERWQQVHDLLGKGTGLLECARRLDLSLNTVKRYARASQPERLQRAPQYRPALADC